MDKKLVAVCVLTVMAIALMLANFATPPAKAATAIAGGGYQIATGHLATGGEAVYVLDNRSGIVAVFSYDPNFKQLKPRDAMPASAALGGPAK